jgi:hypothetical protein
LIRNSTPRYQHPCAQSCMAAVHAPCQLPMPLCYINKNTNTNTSTFEVWRPMPHAACPMPQPCPCRLAVWLLLSSAGRASASCSRSTRRVGAPCPQWEVPWVGTPAPGEHLGAGSWEVCMQLVHTGARPSGATKQAAEVMPSSQGDARAADRTRTRTQGGGEDPRVRLRLALAFWGFMGFRCLGESRLSTLRRLGPRRA